MTEEAIIFDIKKKELELSRVRFGIDEYDFKIFEFERKIKKTIEDKQVSVDRVKELEKEIKELKSKLK